MADEYEATELDNLSTEELLAKEQEIIANDLGTGPETQPTEPEETDDEDTESEESEELEDDDAEDDEESDEDEEESSEEVTHDPLKDTKAAFTRVSMENAKLRAQIKKLEMETKKAEFSGLDYTEDELALIKESDPDQYLEIKTKVAEKKKFEEESQKSLAQDRIQAQMQEMAELLKGYKIPKDKAGDFFSSPEFLEVDQYLTTHVKPEGLSGEYSARQIRMVMRELHGDAFERDSKIQMNRELKQKSKAGQGDILSSGKGKANSKGSKKMDELTADEIENMSEAEIEALLKQV